MSLVGELNENKILYAGKLVIALRENRTKYTPRKPLCRIWKKKERPKRLKQLQMEATPKSYFIFLRSKANANYHLNQGNMLPS